MLLSSEIIISDTSSLILLSMIDELAILEKFAKMPEKLNLRFSGTLGLLLKAKEIGVIDKLKPIIEKIRKTNFRVSDATLQSILDIIKE